MGDCMTGQAIQAGAARHRQAGFNQAGFTLLELLIALAVFAIMAAMAYSGLASVLEAREEVDETLATIADLQGAIHRMQMDLEQAVPRSVRYAYGDPHPALRGLPEQGIEFTRNGWRNPLSLPRSHLQRVAYRINEDGDLVRLSWLVLDRAQDSVPIERVLIEGVKDVEWRFLNEQREWVDVWPPGQAARASGAGSASEVMPRAVELRLETEAWGELRYLFLIPGPPS